MASFLPGWVIIWEPSVYWESNMRIKIGKGVTLILGLEVFGYPAGGDPWEPPDPNSQHVPSRVGFKVPGMGGGRLGGLELLTPCSLQLKLRPCNTELPRAPQGRLGPRVGREGQGGGGAGCRPAIPGDPASSPEAWKSYLPSEHSRKGLTLRAPSAFIPFRSCQSTVSGKHRVPWGAGRAP